MLLINIQPISSLPLKNTYQVFSTLEDASDVSFKDPNPNMLLDNRDYVHSVGDSVTLSHSIYYRTQSAI